LNPAERDSGRISKILRKQAESLNFTGIEFSVSLKAIDKFERLNPKIAVSVFGYENSIYHLRISKFKRENNVTLLLENKHFCLDKSLSRLCSSQSSKDTRKKEYCLRCLNHFPNKKALEQHEEYCDNYDAVKLTLPEKGVVAVFKNHKHLMRVPIVVYADFESFTRPIDTCNPDPEKSFTKKYQKHEPSGFCFFVKCLGKFLQPVLFTETREEENVSNIFVERLEKEIDRVWYSEVKPMMMTDEDKINFYGATRCWICQKDFFEGDQKVRDHCHYSGKFCGAAHNSCNLLFRKPKHVPVFFHNLSGYDSHLFIKSLGKGEGRINCIRNNEEKYISFSKTIINGETKKKFDIRFVDSYKFMMASLDKLVGNLNDFPIISEYFPEQSRELLLRKGVFPYDWFNTLEKYIETQLPSKEEFYSKLSDSDITDDDVVHAQKVWEHFGMKTFREYHDLYLKTDVLLLADDFENFRNICLNNYDLDPAWYYTSPGLAWDACLKKTGVELELLSDPDMLLMVEQGIRGGVSMISKRYAKANNKYMGEKFDPNEEPRFIQCLDTNNLYGWAMSQPFPVRDFKWMDEKEKENCFDFSNQEWCGCILEADLEYPKGLHDLHDDYPLAPERLMVNRVEKLIPNLRD